ncbi:Uu.00g038290.m01.CDS01 [Anthostomella pinea]|uniref:Uu.00g038290.m01.CDS01 n=1 Tax=Anthostomella pinea TaxID=933095 RepID=A0AAI8V9T3_9PEZI|nr:Uu.00g038290.m01.CDS01 [Anthostomella pinea]
MRFNDCSDEEESYYSYGSAHTLEKAVCDPMNAADTTSNDHGSSLARAVNDYPSGPPS